MTFQAATPEVGLCALAILAGKDIGLRLHLFCILGAQRRPPHHLWLVPKPQAVRGLLCTACCQDWAASSGKARAPEALCQRRGVPLL